MNGEWRVGVSPLQYNEQHKRSVVTTASNLAVISASSSRMFTNYEISDEISRKTIQCLERKYGGRIRAHAAARTIQRAYRRYRLTMVFTRQWNNLTLQPNGSTRRRYDRAMYYENHALPENQQLSAHDKQHLRQLALSQPSLRYNPVTSLRAQLRAERFATEYSSPSSFSQLSGTSNFSPLRVPPSPRPMETSSNGSQRQYIELMSPRLSQRRSVVPSNLYRPNLVPNANSSISPLIWVPRKSMDAAVYNTETHLLSDYPSMSNQIINHQTNSLDRRRDRIYHHDEKACSSINQMHDFSDLKRRRLYRIALNFFNKKPDRGLQLLIAWGFVEKDPHSISKLFLGRRGLSKQMIGEFLGTLHSPFHASVLDCFVNEIDLYQMDVDVALRHMLTFFRLPGEAQKIDHIMQVFSRRYKACNPDRLSPSISIDTIYMLAFAIIMLNTDLHTPSLKNSKRMKVDDFIKNIRGIDEGKMLDRNMLTQIYERVKEREFRPGNDHVTQVMKVDQSIIGNEKPKLVESHRRLICYCRLHQIVDANKRQTVNAHQREIFLFNDLMLVAKLFAKKKSVAQYNLRYWTSLIGLKIEPFQNQFYNYGLSIECPNGDTWLFNAKNADDRYRFLSDVRESVMESTEMESIRIDLELDKQIPISFGINGAHRFSRIDNQRDSGLPDIEQQNSSELPELLNGNASNSSAVGINSLAKHVTSPTMGLNANVIGFNNGGHSITYHAASRRLSFNSTRSMDSGMVEENNGADLSV